jgi:uncharacterized RmlC-like cupin family protein
MAGKLFRWRFSILISLVGALAAAGQTSQTKDAVAWTEMSIKSQAKVLLAAAEKNPAGIATATLEQYPGHLVMLTVRTKNGRAEMHAQSNDIIFVIDGEATILTGGTIVDPKEIAPQETRGTKLEGGVPTNLKKGDVMHISPGVPHQTIVGPDKPFTYYVVKVTEKAP